MDLFATPVLARETFASRKLAIIPILGDGMAPTLRGGWDYVLAAPVARFLYDSLYVLNTGAAPTVYRCQSLIAGHVVLKSDNSAYPDRHVSHDWFDEHVLGIVACDLRVRDHDLLQRSRGPGA
jgi:phage repressor protein C with HTH and peptisase S24 domain